MLLTTETADHPTKTLAGPRGVTILLRVEGLIAGIAAIAAYSWLGASWWMFAALILAPDLAMLGYLRGPRAGAAWYNGAHGYVLPALVAAASYVGHLPLLLAIALIWTAHIGLDRAMGYGLKLPGDFKQTHLS